MHRIMPTSLTKLILLDVDTVFKTDIKSLFELFHDFDDKNVIGIARENQPVYRSTFWDYRKKHPNTRVGGPPPSGLTGYNSGVVLLDLNKMRISEKYNMYLNEVHKLSELVRKYNFKGHLGDQDIFTLLSLENEELFFSLPCGWNRQLCTWWKRDEFEEVFDLYFKCNESIHILHGNCRTEVLS